MIETPRGERRLARDTAMSVGSSAVVRVVGAVGGVASARLLGPAGKGTYSILLTVATVAGTFATVGVEVWISRQVARGGVTAAVRHVLRRHSAVALGSLMFLGLAAGSIAVRAGRVTAMEAIVTVLAAGATTSFLLWSAVLLGSRKMLRYAALSFSGSCIYVVVIGVLLAAGYRSPAAVLGGAMVGKWLAVPFAWRTARTSADPDDGGAPTAGRRPYREALRFGLPASAGDVLEFATYRVDYLVVGALAGATQVGLYSTATALAELLWLVPNAIALVLLPHVAAAPERRDSPRLVRLTVLAMSIAGAVVVIFDRLLIRSLFGSDFEGATAAVPALVVASITLGVWKLLVADLTARGRSGAQARTGLGGLVTMVGLDLTLVPHDGIRGAAVAAAAGYTVAAVLASRSWRSTTEGSYRELFVPQRSDIGAVLASWSTRRRAPTRPDD